MNELYLEIAEDMRRERAEKLWRSFGRLAVIASVAIVLATVVFVLWQGHVQNRAGEKTGKLLQGLDRMNIEDFKGAVPIFSSLMEDEDSSYYAFAGFRKAQAQTLGGDSEGAKKTYGEIAKTDSAFADIAKLKSTPAGQTIAITPASPFYYSVSEYNAWQLLEQQKTKEAADIFAQLAGDEKTPSTLAARAEQALMVIAPDRVAKLAADKAAANQAGEEHE